MPERKRFAFLAVVLIAYLAFAFRTGKAHAHGPYGEYPNLSPAEARELISKRAGDPGFVLLDVRTPKEYQEERIGGAVLLDYMSKDFRTELTKLDRGKAYLVYCRTGNRTVGALKAMKEEGFVAVYHLDGGIVKWKEAGLPAQK